MRRTGRGCEAWRSFTSFEKSQNTGLYLLNAEIPHPVIPATGADPPAERHPAREENADALLDGDVGIRRAIARTDDDVPEIEMVGRDVDRDERLRSLCAVDGEFLGQEAEQQSARGVL